ncbi:hypothetical protein GEMRC1_002683 [Eukaryota sp. GEM-RC1]
MRSNKELVESLLVRDPEISKRVANAMLRIDRKHFVPSDILDRAYMDMPQPIGHGQTISAPHIHARMISDLDEHLFPGANVMDIGTGSGYVAAIMADLVGEKGHVTAVETIGELTTQAQRNLTHYPHLKERITFVTGDGKLGYPPNAPYDCIHTGAGGKVPQPLIDQLETRGPSINSCTTPLCSTATAHPQERRWKVRCPTRVGCDICSSSLVFVPE